MNNTNSIPSYALVFLPIYENDNVKYAHVFAGVIQEETFYGKKCSLGDDQIEYISIATKNLSKANAVSFWNVPKYRMNLTSEADLADNRIVIPSLTTELKEAIDIAVEEYFS